MGNQTFMRRIADRHADYIFPQSTLLPLKRDTFAGHNVLIPNEPYTFLSWEYGRCLGMHMFHGVMFNCLYSNR
eukprot:UN08039